MLLVGNGRLVSRDETVPCLEDGCVAIDGGLSAAVGPTAVLRAACPDASFPDAQGGPVMPGLINTHTQPLQRLCPRPCPAGL